MITKQDIYRCYSYSLMEYLILNNIKYLIVAKDIKSNRVFYAYEKTPEFLRLLQQWIDNNPKNKI